MKQIQLIYSGYYLTIPNPIVTNVDNIAKHIMSQIASKCTVSGEVDSITETGTNLSLIVLMNDEHLTKNTIKEIDDTIFYSLRPYARIREGYVTFDNIREIEPN